MSLPTLWIDRIFDKLTLTYGQAFLRRWQDIDLNAVKSDWAHELAGFDQHPAAIAWALQNLPTDTPPTVLQFRALARKSPAEIVPLIEAPKADRDRIAAELAKLAPVRTARRRGGSGGDKEWARRIVENDARGYRSKSSLPLKMAKDALRERSAFASEGAAA